MEEEKEKEFRVTDKRSAFKETPPEPTKNDIPPTSSTQPEEPQQIKDESVGDQATHPPIPEANLLTLLFSLYANAQISLGVLANPMTQQQEKDLEQAKYHIDLLGILKEKTKNNLTQEEEQALDNILYELRMTYISVNK